MRVLVAGASGVLGRRIVRQLVARNHRVVGLARSETAEATVRSLGGEPRRADLFDANAVAQAAQGCEIIIRAATAIPTKVRSGPTDWVMNDRIRREGTRSLVAATARVGARAFLQESVVWAVGTLDGRPVLVGRQSPLWSLIHTDDAASAFVTAAEAPKPGVWHVVDDRPVTLVEFLGEMAKRLGARPPRRMPRWLARMFLGRYGTRL